MLLHNTTTQEAQSLLASYCRTGELPVMLEVNTERIKHYRRLVYNVVDDTLRSAFPLTYHLLNDHEWDLLIEEFFAFHPCQSPQVWSMPKELYDYVMLVDHPLCAKYPFLGELLWFEWIEIEMYMQEDKKPGVGFSKKGELQAHKLVINPEHQIEHFYYPVHLKNAGSITEDDFGDYYLAIHRMPDTGKLEFTQLSPALVRILELLSEKPATVKALLDTVVKEFDLVLTKEIVVSVVNFIRMALDKHLILGYQLEA